MAGCLTSSDVEQNKYIKKYYEVTYTFKKELLLFFLSFRFDGRLSMLYQKVYTKHIKITQCVSSD